MTAPADVVTSNERRKAYLDAGLWDDTTLAGRVGEHAASTPEVVAVIDEAGRYTYGRLAVDTAAVAAALSDYGVDAGSVVSIQLPNRYEAVVAAVAVQSLGAVINPLLPNYRLHELNNVFEAAAPKVIFTPGEYRGFDHRVLVRDVVAHTGAKVQHVVVGDDPGDAAVAFPALLSRGGDAKSLDAGRATDVSEIIFTSGTEAKPKAIMHTE